MRISTYIKYFLPINLQLVICCSISSFFCAALIFALFNNFLKLFRNSGGWSGWRGGGFKIVKGLFCMGSRAKKMQLFLAKFSKIGISLLFFKKKRPKQPTPSPPETTNPPPIPRTRTKPGGAGGGGWFWHGGFTQVCVWGYFSCFRWSYGGLFQVGEGGGSEIRWGMEWFRC